MQIFLQYSFTFIIGGIVGWFIELIYRSIKSNHLTSPGFLGIPFLPVYGFGTLLLHFVSDTLLKTGFTLINNSLTEVLFVFIIITILLTIVEYVAGMVFIKVMKIKLWNYTKQPFNYKGIVCPVFSLIWGILGTVFFFIIDPLLITFFDETIKESIPMILLLGFTYGILVVEVCKSLELARRIRHFGIKEKIVINYHLLKFSFNEKMKSLNKKTIFFRPFRHTLSNLKKFKETLSEIAMNKKGRKKGDK